MNDETLQLERQLLDKLLAERVELDQHIALLQKRLRLANGADAASTGTRSLDEFNGSVNVQKGEFYGLSRPQAAAALLKKAKQNLTTNQIFERLKETGYDGLSGKNAFNGLYTALTRAQEITKVAPNTWGLREWYPHLKEKKRAASASNDPPPPLSLDDD